MQIIDAMIYGKILIYENNLKDNLIVLLDHKTIFCENSVLLGLLMLSIWQLILFDYCSMRH